MYFNNSRRLLFDPESDLFDKYCVQCIDSYIRNSHTEQCSSEVVQGLFPKISLQKTTNNIISTHIISIIIIFIEPNKVYVLRRRG